MDGCTRHRSRPGDRVRWESSIAAGVTRSRGGRSVTTDGVLPTVSDRIGGHRCDARDADIDARAPNPHRGSNCSAPRDRRPWRSVIARDVVGEWTFCDRRLANGADVLLVAIPRPADPVAVDRARVITAPAEEGGLLGDLRPLVVGSYGSSHRASLPSRDIKPPAMLVGGPVEYTNDYGRNDAPDSTEKRLRWGVCPSFGDSVTDRSNWPISLTVQVSSLEWCPERSFTAGDLPSVCQQYRF